MYAVKISGTIKVLGFMRTQIKIPLKLSQNDNFSTRFVWLLCQQSKSRFNINAAFDRFILHIMQYGMYLQYTCSYTISNSKGVNEFYSVPYTYSPFSNLARQNVYQRFIHEV